MTPEERDLITGLFGRLKAADTPSKDREADDLIRKLVAQVPAAPYLLTQTALVQEEALKGAEAHIADLEEQLANARQAAANSGSFLNRVRRPWETPQSAPPAPPQSGPWQQAPYPPPGYAPPGYAAPASGGFLHSALSTAAGVAGGALLFSGIERMLGYGGGPFGGYGGMGMPGYGGGMGMPMENVTVNNYYGEEGHAQHHTEGASHDDHAGHGHDQDYTKTSYDQNAADDNGNDDGGSDYDGGGGDMGGGDMGGDFT